MNDNQFKNLDSINGVEEISQENAAAVSGGAITLYDLRDLQGDNISFNSSVGDLRLFGFNDKASSIKITDGQKWELFQRANFGGASITYTNGIYNLGFDKGIQFNNTVTSLLRH